MGETADRSALPSSALPEPPAPDVTLEEFFYPAFMETHTRFDSIGAFWAASPWTVEGPADIEEIPTADLDRFVVRTTQFDTWLTMRNRAAQREIYDRLLI